MRLRGCSIGAQPTGFEIIENTIEDKYYDLLAYDRVLTDEELKEYELDYIRAADIKERFLWSCYGIDWKVKGIR